MYDVSRLTIEELKFLRRFCLTRYTQTDPSDPKHSEWGKLADRCGYRLNDLTGTTKWKR